MKCSSIRAPWEAAVTDDVREAHDTFVDVQAPPLRRFRGPQLAWLILIWGMLATLVGFVLWRDAVDPHGMVVEGLWFWISFRSRLGPLSVLVFCALVFAMIVQANGLRQLSRACLRFWLLIGARRPGSSREPVLSGRLQLSGCCAHFRIRVTNTIIYSRRRHFSPVGCGTRCHRFPISSAFRISRSTMASGYRVGGRADFRQ
jgi:hypothetical protein